MAYNNKLFIRESTGQLEKFGSTSQVCVQVEQFSTDTHLGWVPGWG